MMTHFDMTNLIKELKTLLELLKESLTNLTKLHAGLDPKKNLHPHSNETEDKKNKNSTQTTINSRHSSHLYKTQQSSTKKKNGQHWNPTTTPPPKKRSPWKKESNKHKPQISLIETKNKFELMETESQESPSKQRNPKYPKSLKIRSKNLETFEIFESSQMKK